LSPASHTGIQFCDTKAGAYRGSAEHSDAFPVEKNNEDGEIREQGNGKRQPLYHRNRERKNESSLQIIFSLIFSGAFDVYIQ
jgi:hypothetical protein